MMSQAEPNDISKRRRADLMSIRSLRLWSCIHRWTSLISTLFLLVICVTGLPLLFSDEIHRWLGPHSYDALPADKPVVSLDALAARGREMYPGQIVSSFFIDDDEPQIYLWMAPSWAAFNADRMVEHFIRFDARTGNVLEQSQPLNQKPRAFMDVMLSLHRDLFAGLPGELFLGFTGCLFISAIVSGVVLYAPFMRKAAFGTVRKARSARIRWLDQHNLLGIVTVAWALVVGATGVMNELSTPLFAIWQKTDVEAMLAPWKGKAPPADAELSSPQAALETASQALPGMRITSVVFPGGKLGSPHHYLLWGKGDTPLTGRLFNPVLVDAKTGELAAVVKMPWYLRALEISRPLHFGDYGGLPLKIIWALLDLTTIVVLLSGLYLWFARRKISIGIPAVADGRWESESGTAMRASERSAT